MAVFSDLSYYTHCADVEQRSLHKTLQKTAHVDVFYYHVIERRDVLTWRANFFSRENNSQNTCYIANTHACVATKLT